MILSGNCKDKIVDIALNLDDEIKDVKISKLEAVTQNKEHSVPDRDEPTHQTAPAISSRSSQGKGDSMLPILMIYHWRTNTKDKEQILLQEQQFDTLVST